MFIITPPNPVALNKNSTLHSLTMLYPPATLTDKAFVLNNHIPLTTIEAKPILLDIICSTHNTLLTQEAIVLKTNIYYYWTSNLFTEEYYSFFTPLFINTEKFCYSAYLREEGIMFTTKTKEILIKEIFKNV